MGKISHLLRNGIADLGTKAFVFTIEEAKKKFGLDRVVKLAGNTNPLGPAPKAIQKIKDAAEQVNLYPDPQSLKLRSALAETYGVTVDQVLAGSGSSELIQLIGEVFINEGDDCLVPEGIFKPFRDICRIMGGKIVASPLKNYHLDFEDMVRRITKKTKLVAIVNPSNPTGVIVRHSEIKDFLDKIGKNVIVVLDEAYGEYTEDKAYPRPVEFIEEGYPVVALRTLSKAYGLAGSRVGYAISSPEIIEYLNVARLRFNVNMFAQAAAIEALKDREHLKQCIQLVWDEKKYYYDEFKKMGLFFLPTEANFVFVEVGVDAEDVRDRLLKRGVIITPLTAWGFEGFLRVSIGTHKENKRCISSLKEVLKEMK